MNKIKEGKANNNNFAERKDICQLLQASSEGVIDF